MTKPIEDDIVLTENVVESYVPPQDRLAYDDSDEDSWFRCVCNEWFSTWWSFSDHQDNCEQWLNGN